MLDRITISALEGRVAAPSAKLMNIDAQIKADIHENIGIVRVNVRVVRILEPDKAETDPENTVPHYIGAITARGRLLDPNKPPPKRELIQEMWPTISVLFNDHARRLGATAFSLPLKVSDLELRGGL